MITPGENWVIVDTVFSIGTAATGLGPTSLLYFPSASGEINSPFSGMRDCAVYCFETFYRGEIEVARRIEPLQTFTLLLRLAERGTRLTLQERTAAAGGAGPWQIGDASATHCER